MKVTPSVISWIDEIIRNIFRKSKIPANLQNVKYAEVIDTNNGVTR